MSATPAGAGGHGASLSGRTLRGLAWMFAGAGGQALLRVATLAVLSRLLTPAEFGVASAALAVVALADVFGQIGIAPAIVQLRDLKPIEIRTAQTTAVAMGVAAAAAVALAAEPIAAAFRMPQLAGVLQALSVIFVIRSVSVVAEAQMHRRMRFKALAAIGAASYAAGPGLVAVALALRGHGVWALVCGHLAQALVATICLQLAERTPLSPAFDRAAMRRLLAFGFGMTLTSIGNLLALNLDQFIVGRWLGAASLGAYNRAYAILVQPANLLGAVGDKVLFPALATIQQDRARLARAYARAVGLIAATTLPLSVFLFLFAEELVLLLLGGQWTAVVGPFRALVVSLFFRTAYKMTSALLRARGLVYRLAGWQWMYAAALALAAGAGLPFGLTGVACGVAAAIFATFEAGLLLARQACGVDLAALHRAIARHAALALFVNAPALALLAAGAGRPSLVEIALAGAACALLAAGAWRCAPSLFGDEGLWLRDQMTRRPRRARPSV